MKDLKQRALRGGFAKMCAQVANYALRIGSLMVMARLLSPRDFGLVGMVTAFTGVLSLFRDFGLSAATVQRVDVTEHRCPPCSGSIFWSAPSSTPDSGRGAYRGFLLSRASSLLGDHRGRHVFPF